MYIECDNCSAGFELELPPAAFELGRNLKFRCTSCGHSFLVVEGGAVVDSVVLAGPEPAEREPPSVTTVEEDGAGAAQLPPVSPAPRPMEHVLLRQEGTAYNVPDLATLQRWVVERRVGPEDELDFGDKEWVRAIDHPELQPFFEVVEQAETASGSLEPVEPGPDSTDAEARPSPPDPTDPDHPGGLSPGESSPEPAADAASPEGPPAQEAVAPEPDAPAEGAHQSEDALHAEDDHEAAATEEAEHWPEALAPAAPPSGEPEAAEHDPSDPTSSGPEPELSVDEEVAESSEDEPFVPQTEPRTAAAILDGPEDSSSEPSSEDFTFPAAPGQRDGWEIIEPGSLPARPAASSIGVPGEAPVVDATAPEGASWGVEGKADAADASANIDWFGSGIKLGVPKRNLDVGAEAAGGAAGADLTDDATEEWFSGSVAPVDGPGAPPNLAAAADAEEEVVPDEPEEAGDRMLGVVAVVAVLAAIGILVWVIRDGGPASPSGAVAPVAESTEVARPVAPAPLEPGPAAPPVPDTLPAPEPELPAAEEAPAPAEPAAPEPPPKARTTPPPPPDSRSTRARGAEAITRQGWSDVDRKRFSSAKRNFEKAIAAQNNHGPAHFGLGYVLERMGDQPGALDAYCKAQLFAGSDKELRREIRGRLNAIKGTCP